MPTAAIDDELASAGTGWGDQVFPPSLEIDRSAPESIQTEEPDRPIWPESTCADGGTDDGDATPGKPVEDGPCPPQPPITASAQASNAQRADRRSGRIKSRAPLA